MELTADLFERTLHQLKGAASASVVEKRSSPRAGVRCRVRLQPVENGQVSQPIDVWTRDISVRGMGIVSPRRMKIGAHYLLWLKREDSDKHDDRLGLYCTVRNCHELADRLYGIGLKIVPLTARSQTCALPTRTESEEESRIRKAILG